MEISYIKEFITLVECKYYAEAADQLFISPSSLTRHIQTMEKEFDKPLFIRTSRKVELTDFGSIYYEYAKKIVYLQEEFIKEHLIKERRDERLIIGYLGGIAQCEIGILMAKFRKENPDVRVDFLQVNPEEQFEFLSESKYDFLITGERMIPKDKFDSILCGRDIFALVVPETHAYAGRKKITVSELPDERISIVYVLADERGEFMKRLKEEHIYPDFDIIDVHNAIDRVIIEGKPIIMSQKLAERLGGSTVSIIDIDPVITCKIALVYRKSAKLSLKEKRFYNFFCENVEIDCK